MTTLIIPGLNNSGPNHWQTWLEAQLDDAIRVQQRNWAHAELEGWSKSVTQALGSSRAPAFLVCHSFGCLAAMHAAVRLSHRKKVAGALLVAPADPVKWQLADTLPQTALPFPTILVASRNDPWLGYHAAVEWASRWGSRVIDLGDAGHVNAESGFGPWPLGRRLLEELAGMATAASIAARRCPAQADTPAATSQKTTQEYRHAP